MSKAPQIESWFWKTISESNYKLSNLESALSRMSRPQLEKFMVYYDIAMSEVCGSWDGPCIDDHLEPLSEDSTEDLTDWIVSQGIDVWQYACSDRVDFPLLNRLSNRITNDDQQTLGMTVEAWDNTVEVKSHQGWQCPMFLPRIIYEERFYGNYFEDLERLYEDHAPAQ